MCNTVNRLDGIKFIQPTRPKALCVVLLYVVCQAGQYYTHANILGMKERRAERIHLILEYFLQTADPAADRRPTGGSEYLRAL